MGVSGRDNATTWFSRAMDFPCHVMCDNSKLPGEGQWGVAAGVFTVERFSTGDPISLYLFLLCGEGLSCMLQNYNGGWIDRGIRVSNVAPWISHLLFADDTMLLFHASGQQVNLLTQGSVPSFFLTTVLVRWWMK